MSLIEQAAKRLEELRRAGIEAPDAAPAHDERIEPAVTVQKMKRARHDAQVQREQLDGSADGHSAESRHVHLDLARLAAAGLVTPDAPRSHLADEFRVIKRPLITNATGKGASPLHNGNLIMVTSALEGEGKSFTAANLAMSIAMELDHTVLLVDADVARSSIPGMLGLPESRGLLDVLVSGDDLRDVLLRTDIEKLSVLPAGTPHPRATELLASDSMNDLLDEISARYADRIVVFDSPPLLLTTEARVLATHMGQVVIVVEAQHTSQADVKHALATIESCPVKMVMLNKARVVPGGENYRYGYGYSYGYSR